jgi:hypothetical protein
MLGYNWVISLVTWRKSPVVAGVDPIDGKASNQIRGNYFTLGLVSPYDPSAAPDKIGKSLCVRSFF